MNTPSAEEERMHLMGRGAISFFQSTTSFMSQTINPALPRSSFVFTAAGLDVDPHPCGGQPISTNTYSVPGLPSFQSTVQIPPFDYSTQNFPKVAVSNTYMASVKRTFEKIFPEGDDVDKRFKQTVGESQGATSASSAGCISRSVKQLFDTDAPRQKDKSIRGDPSSFKRKWDYKTSKHYKQTKGCTFSLLSYNVLAQGLLEDNRYLYRNVRPKFLDWRYRKDNLLYELLYLGGDILCLQEVERIHYEDFFQPNLGQCGYAGVYKQRTGIKSDGCAIFFKTNKFNLVMFKAVSFRKSNISLLDRDNVGVIVLLQSVQEPKVNVCVATTHLLFNPRRGDIKIAQLGLFLAEIDKISHSKTEKGDYEQCPVILCGDMNSVPGSPLSKFIQNGEMDFNNVLKGDVSGQTDGRRGPAKILGRPLLPSALNITRNCQFVSALDERKETKSSSSKNKETKDENSKEHWGSWTQVGSTQGIDEMVVRHPFTFSSVYPLDEKNKAVTSNHANTNCMVDYIFFSAPRDRSSKGTRGRLELLSSLQLFTDEEATEMGGLPNSIWSSDHFSLMASFLLKP